MLKHQREAEKQQMWPQQQRGQQWWIGDVGNQYGSTAGVPMYTLAAHTNAISFNASNLK